MKIVFIYIVKVLNNIWEYVLYMLFSLSRIIANLVIIPCALAFIISPFQWKCDYGDNFKLTSNNYVKRRVTHVYCHTLNCSVQLQAGIGYGSILQTTFLHQKQSHTFFTKFPIVQVYLIVNMFSLWMNKTNMNLHYNWQLPQNEAFACL